MSAVFYVLVYAQGFLALSTALYGTYVWLTDREDIVTRYVMSAGTSYYMWLFGCAMLVGRVPA